MDTPADRLRRARIARGFSSAAEAARAFRWNEVTYQSHENGHRGIRQNAAAMYARAFGISAAELLGLGRVSVITSSTVPIIGTAESGVWRESAFDKEQNANLPSLDVPVSSRDSSMRQAIQIADDHANLAFSPGEFAIFDAAAPVDAARDKISLYVVSRSKPDGLQEITVRRAVPRTDGAVGLVGHCTGVKIPELIYINGKTDPSIKILGKVVGSFKKFD